MPSLSASGGGKVVVVTGGTVVETGGTVVVVVGGQLPQSTAQVRQSSLGLQILSPQGVGGSVVVEYVFGWQGLGFQVLEILTTDGAKDYPFILAATTLFVGLTVLLHLFSDLATLASDPRLRTAPAPA